MAFIEVNCKAWWFRTVDESCRESWWQPWCALSLWWFLILNSFPSAFLGVTKPAVFVCAFSSEFTMMDGAWINICCTTYCAAGHNTSCPGYFYYGCIIWTLKSLLFSCYHFWWHVGILKHFASTLFCGYKIQTLLFFKLILVN